MTHLHTAPLHPDFGVRIEGVDLREVGPGDLFARIRDAFERHSLLLFPGQALSDEDHTRLAQLFGPLENRDAMAGLDVAFKVSPVSNEVEGGVSDPEALHTQSLKANMLWHTDSTFLPVPALVNLLTATVVPSSGGETEFVSTRAGWAAMPESLRAKLKGAILWHRFSHSRAQVSAELAGQHQFTRWPDRPWRAVWPNPVTGAEALYIASHAFAIEGMGLEEGQSVLAEAMAFCTRAEAVYSHRWTPGDVLIWDERATLHRGQPWPYREPRTLKSICCSVTDADGLASVRIV